VTHLILDSSVVISFIRSGDAHHASTCAEIRAARLRDDEFVLPATVLAESLVAAFRAGPGTADRMRHELVAFFGAARPADEAVAVAAADLRSRHRSLRLPDALVVATGIVDDGVVLTCDRRLADVDERVQLVGA
jgi:predicted nucleic acid-binding protein